MLCINKMEGVQKKVCTRKVLNLRSKFLFEFTESAWVMTRDRLPPNLVLQRAYGVLDKYKISRAFFIKTGQEDCTVQPQAIEPVDPVDLRPAAETAPASLAAAPAAAARDAQDVQESQDVPNEVESTEENPSEQL